MPAENPHRIPGMPVILHPKFDDALEFNVQTSMIPEHMHEGVIAYFRYGRPCGSFLQAVISNDLAEAVRRGDQANLRALASYIILFANCAPIGSWGSPDNYDGWLQKGREAREAAKAQAEQ